MLTPTHKHYLLTTVWVLALGFLLYLQFVVYNTSSKVVVYDCRLAEISPDYPVDVKQKCREAMRNSQTEKGNK